MKLERSTPQDAKECVNWLTANLEANDCSARTLKGCTFWKIPGILYLPVKPVLMLESLAPNPSITGTKRLLALRRAVLDLQQIYPGIEIQFLSRKDVPLMDGAGRLGFEEAEGYVLCRLFDAKAGREKAKQRKKGLAQARLQDNARAHRAVDVAPAGAVRDLPEAARRQPAIGGPQRRDHACAGNPLQSL